MLGVQVSTGRHIRNMWMSYGQLILSNSLMQHLKMASVIVFKKRVKVGQRWGSDQRSTCSPRMSVFSSGGGAAGVPLPAFLFSPTPPFPHRSGPQPQRRQWQRCQTIGPSITALCPVSVELVGSCATLVARESCRGTRDLGQANCSPSSW